MAIVNRPGLLHPSVVYCPLNGEPKIPTANSAQMSKSNAKRATQSAMRSRRGCTFLITHSNTQAVTSNSTPAIIKSNHDQFTSCVNCIAMNGTSNKITMESNRKRSRLYCIIVKIINRVCSQTNYHATQKLKRRLLFFSEVDGFLVDVILVNRFPQLYFVPFSVKNMHKPAIGKRFNLI
jgi:hypothetical protein